VGSDTGMTGEESKITQSNSGSTRSSTSRPRRWACRFTKCWAGRCAQRLGLDVDERVLDRRDRHLIDPAGGLPGRSVEMGAVTLDRARVLPDQKPLG